MVHGYNTRGKKQELVMNNQDQMKNVEVNIINRINFLKDKIINFKGTAIRNLQDEKWEVKV